MKILFHSDNFEQWPKLLKAFDIKLSDLEKGKVLFSDSNTPYQADFLFTGKGEFETGILLDRQLRDNRYHLVLSLGLVELAEGEEHSNQWLNVIRAIPVISLDPMQTVYDAGLMDASAPPHQRGGLINMTTAYFNVFLEVEKVLIHSYPDPEAGVQAKGGYWAENASAIEYSCLSFPQAFYQLRFPYTKGQSPDYDSAQEQVLVILEQIK